MGRVGLSRHNGHYGHGNGFWGPLGEEAMTENSQQGAEVRLRGNEARSKMGLGGGKACETVAECHVLQCYSPSSDIHFPSCRS